METKRIVFISPLGREEAKRLLETIPDGVAVEAKAVIVAPFFDGMIEKMLVAFMPDLIVLGTMLQGDERDGLRVLKAIKASCLVNVPVVVVSTLFVGQHKERLQKELKESGAAAVIAKFPYPSYNELMSCCSV